MEADLLEQAIIESLRDGGSLQPAKSNSSAPAGRGGGANTAPSSADAQSGPSKSNADEAAPAGSSANTARTTRELLNEGKSMQEIDDLLLKQACAATWGILSEYCCGS